MATANNAATITTTIDLYTLAALIIPLLLPLVALYLHIDYKRFLSLGPGGTPSTPLGYAKVKLLSLVSLRDPLRPLPTPPHFRPQRGYLSAPSLSPGFPSRSGSRPLVQGIAPQRQQTQKSTGPVYAALVAGLHGLARDPANRLLERTSCFEKHSEGLFASTPITRTCGGEVCHAHPSDGSMHLSLHPADARIVLEAGWGERHPLAKGGWFRRYVPREFTLVYAPRDEAEVKVVMRIVAAAVWWVSGVDVERKGEKADRELAAGIVQDAQAVESECWAGVEKMVSDA